MSLDAISSAKTECAALDRPGQSKDQNKDLTTHLGRMIRAIAKNDYNAARDHYWNAKDALTPESAKTDADKSILSAFNRIGDAFDTGDNKKIGDAFIALLRAAADSVTKPSNWSPILSGEKLTVFGVDLPRDPPSVGGTGRITPAMLQQLIDEQSDLKSLSRRKLPEIPSGREADVTVKGHEEMVLYKIDCTPTAGDYARGVGTLLPSWWDGAHKALEAEKLRDMEELRKTRRADNAVENVYALFYEGGKVAAIVYDSGITMTNGLGYSQLPSSSGGNLRDLRLAALQKFLPSAVVLYGFEAQEAAKRAGY